MRAFDSSEELFEAVESVLLRMEREGQADAAQIVREGFRCLNGLTDGWALFMESLEKALGQFGERLSDSVKNDLRAVFHATTKAVYR